MTIPFTMQLLDPCILATIVVSPSIVTLPITYDIYPSSTPATVPFNLSAVSLIDPSLICPGFKIVNVIELPNLPLDGAILSFMAPNTLQIDSSNKLDARTYKLRVTASLDGAQYTNTGSFDFDVTLYDGCASQVLTPVA